VNLDLLLLCVISMIAIATYAYHVLTLAVSASVFVADADNVPGSTAVCLKAGKLVRKRMPGLDSFMYLQPICVTHIISRGVMEKVCLAGLCVVSGKRDGESKTTRCIYVLPCFFG
jgi:hypothetical protein